MSRIRILRGGQKRKQAYDGEFMSRAARISMRRIKERRQEGDRTALEIRPAFFLSLFRFREDKQSM